MGWTFRELCRWEVEVRLGWLPLTGRYLDWVTWSLLLSEAVVLPRKGHFPFVIVHYEWERTKIAETCLFTSSILLPTCSLKMKATSYDVEFCRNYFCRNK